MLKLNAEGNRHIFEAERHCESHGFNLYDEIINYMHVGYVYCHPDFFVMAKPVDIKASTDKIINSSYIFSNINCNCLYICLFVGSYLKGISLIPDCYKYLCFFRHGSLKPKVLEVRHLKYKTLK